MVTKQLRCVAFVAVILSSALLGACESQRTTTTVQAAPPQPQFQPAPPPPPQRAPMVRG